MVKNKDIFKKHQEQVFQRLLDILGFKEGDDYQLNLAILNEDEEKKKQILDLRDDVKLFFNAANVTCFKKNRTECKIEYFYVLISIFRLMGYSNKRIEIKEDFKKYTIIKFLKN